MKLAGLTLQIKSLDVLLLLDWEFVIKVQIKGACELRKARPFLLHCQDPVTALDLRIRNLFEVSHSSPTALSEEDIVVCRFLSLTFFPAFSSAPLLWGRTGPCKLPARVTQGRKCQFCCCFCTLFIPHLHALGCFFPLFVRPYSVPMCWDAFFNPSVLPWSCACCCCLKEKETYTIFPEAFPSPVQQRVWFAM